MKTLKILALVAAFSAAFISGCSKYTPSVVPTEQIILKSKEREEVAAEMLLEAKYLAELGNDSSAINVYEKIWKNYAESESAPVAYHEAARIYAKKHQYKKAIELYQIIGSNYQNYDKFGEVINESFDVAYSLMEGNRPYYFGLIPGFKDYDSAIEFFNTVVKMAPSSAQAPKALMCIAKLENEHGKKVNAIAALDKLIENHVGNPLVPEAYLFQAEVYMSLVNGPQYDQGATQKAINCYEDFLVIFSPKSGINIVDDSLIAKAKDGLNKAKMLYAQSRFVIGDFFYYRRHYPAGAITFYDEARIAAPSTDIAENAINRLEDIQNNTKIPTNWADALFGRFTHVPPKVK